MQKPWGGVEQPAKSTDFAGFEAALNEVFGNINAQEGVYEATLDETKHEVKVKILDPYASGALSGTGLIAGFERIYNQFNMVSLKVGDKEAIYIPRLQEESGDFFLTMLAFVIGSHIAEEVFEPGKKLEETKLGEFAGKEVTITATLKTAEGPRSLVYTVSGYAEVTIKYQSNDQQKGEVDLKTETLTDGSVVKGSKATPEDGFVLEKWIDADGNTVSTDEHFVPKIWSTTTYTAVFKEAATVSYKFVSAQEGLELPQAVIDNLPEKHNSVIGNTLSTPFSAFLPVEVGGDNPGTWSFEEWQPEELTVKADSENNVFTGTWTFTPAPPKPTPQPEEPTYPNYTPASVLWALGFGYGDTTTPTTNDNKVEDNKAEDNKEDNQENPITFTDKAYVNGYPDGTFRPNAEITRAEAVAIIARILDYKLTDSTKPAFTDVESDWYNSAINAVVENGLIKGYPDGSFRPNASITRAELVQIIKQIDKENAEKADFADVQGHWAQDAIDQAYGNGRINGYPEGGFRPDAPITRAETVTIINNLLGRNTSSQAVANKLENIDNPQDFNDLSADDWFYYEIMEATN
ncbi:MAG: S-layer homology domain-containing protein [Bacillota bacterium]|nr:S-layer homology domain-containing protein [Bacillota bacterium]